MKQTVKDRKDCGDDDKKQMTLSNITDHGIRITSMVKFYLIMIHAYLVYLWSFLVSSFLELLPYLFSIQGVNSLLSEKLRQDPLEKFFGCQSQQGRSNEKPTVAQFIKNTWVSELLIQSGSVR